MSQGIHLFYTRVSSMYGDDWERFKQDADKNHNNVIQYSELYETIIEDLQISSNIFTRNDMDTLWDTFDKTINGANSLSNNGYVSENGSLNATEEANMNKRIEAYGKISDRVNRELNPLFTNGYFTHYNISRDSVLCLVISELMNGANLDDLVAAAVQGQLDRTIEQMGLVAAIKLVQSPAIQELVKNAGAEALLPKGYDITKDENLLDLIQDYINHVKEDNSTGFTDKFNLISLGIQVITSNYLKSAGIGNGVNGQEGWVWSDDAVGYKWDDNSPLNNLQQKRLEEKYEAALKDYEPEEFADFSEQFKAAKKAFLDDLKNELKNEKSYHFPILIEETDENIQNRFSTSGAVMALRQIVRMGNVGDVAGENMQYGGKNYLQNEEAWAQDANGNNIVAEIFYLAGFVSLDRKYMENLLKNGIFKQYLAKAYEDIMANKEHYGINDSDDLSDLTTVQNAVLKYFKEHAAEIMKACGCSNDEILQGLYDNFRGTYRILYGDDGWYAGNNLNHHGGQSTGYGDYTIDDLRESAKQFVRFVRDNYGDNSAVTEALKDFSLSDIDSMTKEQLLSKINEIMSLLDIKNPKDPTPPETDLDSYKPDLLGTVQSFNVGYVFDWANGNAFNDDAGGILRFRGDLQKSYPGEECGYSKEEWNLACNTLENYIRKLLATFSSFNWSKVAQNDAYNVPCEFTYKDEISGQNVTVTAGTKTGKSHEIYNDSFVDGTSESGVYIYNDDGWIHIALDGNKIWEKFKEFLHH